MIKLVRSATPIISALKDTEIVVIDTEIPILENEDNFHKPQKPDYSCDTAHEIHRGNLPVLTNDTKYPLPALTFLCALFHHH